MSKCKTCQHAIKLHKHPSNRMFNGAISEQVDFIGCVAFGKDKGFIVDGVVEECDGWMGKRSGDKLKTSVEYLKDSIEKHGTYMCEGECIDCLFLCSYTLDCYSSFADYDFAAISTHDFGTLTEVTIEDLEQFKIK